MDSADNNNFVDFNEIVARSGVPVSADEIRELVEKRRQEEIKILAENKTMAPQAAVEIDSKFIISCLNANEIGDGNLYAALNKDNFIFNKTSNEWYSWAGHHWDRDVMNASVAEVEKVSDRYLQEYSNLSEQIKFAAAAGDTEKIKNMESDKERILKRVSRLRSQRGRINCLACACTSRNPISVYGDEFDLNPYVLACKNGVINLLTGEATPGIPEDYIFKACPHEWAGINEPCPEFEKFLDTIFESNQDLVSFMQRLLGYSIAGITHENKFVIFYGQGRNGKSVLVETILHALGPLASPIQSEMLLDQGRSRSSAGPSPDILSLKGLRMAFASETDEGRQFSSSKVKWMSGGDTLVGRLPHDRYETHFLPSHTLYLLTNNKPHASSYDFALWERMLLIPFRLSFVNREPRLENERLADLYIKDKLKKEVSGILAWLVRGFISWSEIGLSPPAIIKDATEEYKREEDILEDFIEEYCYRDTEIKIEASNLYDAFNEWFLKNVSKKGLSQKKFGRLMRKAGFDKVKSGTYAYIGLGLLAK